MRIYRELTRRKRTLSSTLRESRGYRHAVEVLADTRGEPLCGCLVELVGDPQAASAIFRRGGSQRVASAGGAGHGVGDGAAAVAAPPLLLKVHKIAGVPANHDSGNEAEVDSLAVARLPRCKRALRRRRLGSSERRQRARTAAIIAEAAATPTLNAPHGGNCLGRGPVVSSDGHHEEPAVGAAARPAHQSSSGGSSSSE